MFLEIKSIQCDFSMNIVDEEWRLDFKFATDILEKLNELNVKVQGSGIFAHEMYVHVKSFQMKVSLFSRQAGNNTFCNFPLLKEANISSRLAAKYKVQLYNLAVEFERRFQPLRTWNRSSISSALHSLQRLIQLLRIYSGNWWTCKQIMIRKRSSSQIHCLASTRHCLTICFQTWKTLLLSFWHCLNPRTFANKHFLV